MLKQILLSGTLALPIVALNANAQQKPASVFDRNAAGTYYTNFKTMIQYMRNAIN